MSDKTVLTEICLECTFVVMDKHHSEETKKFATKLLSIIRTRNKAAPRRKKKK